MGVCSSCIGASFPSVLGASVTLGTSVIIVVVLGTLGMKMGWRSCMAVRHTGHVSTRLAHAPQHTTWWHGSNSTARGASTHSTHNTASCNEDTCSLSAAQHFPPPPFEDDICEIVVISVLLPDDDDDAFLQSVVVLLLLLL